MSASILYHLARYAIAHTGRWQASCMIDDTTLYISTADSFDKLTKWRTQPTKHSPSVSKYTSEHLPKVFYIALGDNLGDNVLFYPNAKDCPIQLFTHAEWQATLQACPSPSDLLFLLAYRASTGRSDNLAQDLPNLPEFYQRAWQVEKQLQSYDIMARVSDPIKTAIYKKSATLSTRISATSPLYDKLLTRLAQQFLAPKIIQLLHWQCAYTRMKIIEFVLSYAQMTPSDKAIGKLTHEHSYHRVGQHFIVVIYGQDSDSELAKTAIATNYQTILTYFYQQLKDKKVGDIVLLGFDLSKTAPDGGIDVQLDVYY